MNAGRELWARYFAAGLVVVGTSLLLPAGGTAWLGISLLLPVSMVASIALGVRRNRPEQRAGWLILSVGAGIHLAADLVWYPAQADRVNLPFPSIATVLYVSSYAILLVGLARVVRSRSGEGDGASWVDVLIITGGLATLSWMFLMSDYWHGTDLSLLAKLVAIAFPLIDLLLLSIAVRLAFVSRTRDTSSILLGLFILTQLVADTIHGVTQLDGSFTAHSSAFPVWLASYVFLGAAALHPSMSVVTEQVSSEERTTERWRVPVIAVAALVPSLTLALKLEESADVPVIAGISAAMIALAIFRVSRLMVDVDVYRRTQERLQEAEDMYRSLVEELPTVIYRAEFGESGAWSYVGPRIEAMLGFPPAFWVVNPRFWYERIVPEDREHVLAAEVRSRTTGEPFLSEYRLVASDDRIVWVRDEAHVLQGENGAAPYIQGVLVDITERKRAEEALERLNVELEHRVQERTADLEAANADLLEAKEAAERANKAKSEFLSRTSHELRTPLNAILGFGQLIDTTMLTPDDAESVEQILKGGRHLLDLINEVLDISRIESSRLSLSIESVSVDEVVHESIELVQPIGVERGIRLSAEIPAPTPFVLADRQRLKQVLLNLLSNAIKYNHGGGTVHVSCASTDELITIRVTDTGPGIAPELIDRLFSPFDRLGAERTDTEGTGLGLALSKGLIEAMAGTIRVESEASAGTTFAIELQAARDPNEDIPEEAPDSMVGVDGSNGHRTILYIEDNLANLALVERVLVRRPSVKLLAAMQGRLGVELAQQHLPDLVLLDLHLPDIDGSEVLRLLRDDPRTAGIPAVVVSADATMGRVEKLLEAGATEYLTKPLDVARFLEVLDEILRPNATPAAR